ncbi:MAG: redoxin domain-containing protein [Bacteroidales bacterium]|nr:redoxin domain-containing protein [Bacteroidales bacterium]
MMTGCRFSHKEPSPNHEARQETVVIQGNVKNGAGEPVYLDEIAPREFIPVDTVYCNEEGEFSIRFATNRTAFYALRSTLKGYVTLLLEPGEKVRFSGNLEAVHPYSIKGSEGSELIRELSAEHKRVIDAMAEISRKNRASLHHPDYQSIKLQLDRTFDSLASAFYDYSLRFIHDHAPSPAILIALYNQYGYGLPVFSMESDMDVYRFVDSSLSALYPDNESVRMLHAQIKSAEQQMKAVPAKGGLMPGDSAPDFVIRDPDGNTVALSDLRGKHVLLAFWATWSKPGMDENHFLRKAHRMFGEKGLAIFQISLDENPAVWKEVIKSDSLTWYHGSDLMRWDSRINDLYFIEKIPSNFLITPDGKIDSIDLFGQNLIEELEKIF